MLNITDSPVYDPYRKLYPFQREGVEFLVDHKRAYLADAMGLGKTAQAIIAAQSLGATGARRIAVICPAVAVPNWHREIQKWWSPIIRESFWDVMSYDMLRIRGAITPDIVILDEAHYCKSSSAKRTVAALSLARKAERAWLLSGTPMPNHPGELWAPMRYLWPEIPLKYGIRNAFQWLDKFTLYRPTIYGPKPYAVKNGALLRRDLSTMLLRRRLHQVGLELPALRVDVSYLPHSGFLDHTQFREYENMEATQDAYTSTLRRLLGKAKAPSVAAVIGRELDDQQYDKIVVLYYHRAVGDVLWEHFAGVGVVGFDGSTSVPRRQNAIDAFQEGSARVFLAQQNAAGIAINLTAASEVVLVEPAWSPEDNAQAIARIHRIGQDEPCRARIFAVPGTLDESIMTTLTRKLQMQKKVLP